jgi:CRP/FNR family transcriptional regulator, cyclic AMP receptor protein
VQWELFDGVPPEDVQRVLSVARRRRFKRGEVVFHESDPADSLHLVVGGRFAIQRTTRLGDDALLAVRGPGEAFGELALVSADPRSATVYALEAGETMCVQRSEFDRLRTLHPAVDRMLVSLLAHQLRRMNELVTEAYYESAERRVLRRLLDLAAVYGGADGETEVPVTQEQLASLAGASRATVNAVLAAERGRGTIALRRGATIVRDPQALAKRAGRRELPA